MPIWLARLLNTPCVVGCPAKLLTEINSSRASFVSSCRAFSVLSLPVCFWSSLGPRMCLGRCLVICPSECLGACLGKSLGTCLGTCLGICVGMYPVGIS